MPRIVFPVLAAICMVQLLAGCREETTITGTTDGTRNDPVTENLNSYYNFDIAADGLTYRFTDTLKLRTTLSTVAYEVSGYSGGSATIDVLGSSGGSLYRIQVTGDLPKETYGVSGAVPRLVQLIFTNFSGRCKVNVTGIR